ncbi:shikimate kinase [Candidatus Vidania fulgoroideorum]
MNIKNICITGFPGVGKSTFCFFLFFLFEYKFLDIDYLIDNLYNIELNIFLNKKKKEFFFRNVEKNILFLIFKKNILSTGGGVYMNYFSFLFFLVNNSFIYYRLKLRGFRSIVKNNSFLKIINQRNNFLNFQYLFKYV